MEIIKRISSAGAAAAGSPAPHVRIITAGPRAKNATPRRSRHRARGCDLSTRGGRIARFPRRDDVNARQLACAYYYIRVCVFVCLRAARRRGYIYIRYVRRGRRETRTTCFTPLTWSSVEYYVFVLPRNIFLFSIFFFFTTLLLRTRDLRTGVFLPRGTRASTRCGVHHAHLYIV